MRKTKWTEHWDLSSIPDDLWRKELARRRANKRWEAYRAEREREATVKENETVEGQENVATRGS